MKNENTQISSYEPIIGKLKYWINYIENAPKSDYRIAPAEHDSYRSTHDRDCVLTGGDLNADTIISLYIPLKKTITALNDKATREQLLDYSSKKAFCESLLRGDTLMRVLPIDNPLAQLLVELFKLGDESCNVMRLPARYLNSARAQAPYYDYMPAFLNEIFEGGAFNNAFIDAEDWVREQKLGMFFEEGNIDRAHIKNLRSEKLSQKEQLQFYIKVLKERQAA